MDRQCQARQAAFDNPFAGGREISAAKVRVGLVVGAVDQTFILSGIVVGNVARHLAGVGQGIEKGRHIQESVAIL